MACNWEKSDYFSDLLHKDRRMHTALEMMVDDIHADKERTITKFLSHSGSEDFLWGLVSILASDKPRVAGNAAYIIGTLAESDLGCYRVLSLTKTCENQQILSNLTNMLTFDDVESVMNAAGTMGTLAESYEGRVWMLSEDCFDRTIEKITNLLNNKNMWTASNAALVLARVAISEDGCTKILSLPASDTVLSRLITSLGTDEAGRGMNAAFAIGRICDSDAGRKRLLVLPESERMISCLAKMLGCGEHGSSKNACFALSCLAASVEGHTRLLNNGLSDDILTQLSTLLSAIDPETAWFSAMTLRTLAAQPKGCVRLRECPHVLSALQAVLAFKSASDDLCEEIRMTLDILKRLERPLTPTVQVLGSTSVCVKWAKVAVKCGLDVLYQLCENGKSVYRGEDTAYTTNDLTPHQSYHYKLRVVTEGDDSPYSEIVTVTTEEDVPSAPVALHISGVTVTQLKVAWEPPEVMNGEFKGYYVFLGDTQTDHTHDTSCIISSLTPSTLYTIQVCAGTSKGKGERATVEGCTAELGAHCPPPPSVTVLGRYEAHLVWKTPEVPLGRITRYDVTANGKVIYSGTDLSCSEHRLTPDTEYTFIVSALTNEGRFDSKPTRRRTSKDEYDVVRSPLYQPPPAKKDVEEKTNNEQNRRKSTSSIDNKDVNHVRMASACSHKKDDSTTSTTGHRERRRKSDAKKSDTLNFDQRLKTRGHKTNHLWTKNDAVKTKNSTNDSNLKSVEYLKQKIKELPLTNIEIKSVTKPDKSNSPDYYTLRTQNVLETAKTCLVLPIDAERRRGNFIVSESATRLNSGSDTSWGGSSLHKGAGDEYGKNTDDIRRTRIHRGSLKQVAREPTSDSPSPVHPSLWTPSINSIPDNRLTSLSNKFVPMQFRTQPANLSMNIRRMNTQVFDNDEEGFTLKRIGSMLQRSPTNFADFKLTNDGAVLSRSSSREQKDYDQRRFIHGADIPRNAKAASH